MAIQNLQYLPILISIYFPATFILSYIIAVSTDDVTPLFPYISDTGTFSPESCIFGQLLNLGALFVGCGAYLRYLQIKDLHQNNQLPFVVEKLNGRACVLGIITALGISIVGNFQEKNALIVHLIGATFAFGVGGVYLCFQSYISFKIYPLVGNKTLNWIRVILAVGTLIFFVLVFLFAIIAAIVGKNAGNEHAEETINTKWTSDQAGWGWHFASTLSEWILAFCMLQYLATYAYDFRGLTLNEITVSNKLK
ncbi:DNA damage-regulated autophagy modulator protein 2 [Coccinella septempunctata]|uniref:DNA damage-regulated autophagy modulator protein 2 n=1 Tax=Coccinella septempunctata TaxID=41139 RepID=UPI001D0866C5|nr:DNA damage-regulated autophagy modulator protein 2 [Coccinella septempunctata]